LGSRNDDPANGTCCCRAHHNLFLSAWQSQQSTLNTLTLRLPYRSMTK
jgi:hypothetical protein